MNNKSKVVEVVHQDKPWAFIPVEGVKCSDTQPHSRCGNKTLKDKGLCNWNDCPYARDGDDGMF